MHEKKICSKCRAVIFQCRCMDCKKVITYGICDKCKIPGEIMERDKMKELTDKELDEKYELIKKIYNAMPTFHYDENYRSESAGVLASAGLVFKKDVRVDEGKAIPILLRWGVGKTESLTIAKVLATQDILKEV